MISQMPVFESIQHVEPDKNEKTFGGEIEGISRVKQKSTASKNRRDERLIILSVFGLLLFIFYYLQHIPPTSPRSTYHKQVRILGNSLVLDKSVSTTGTKEGKEEAFQIPSRLRPFFYAPVPINIADQQLLETIKGIGQRLSLEIIQTRTLKGPFKGPEDLLWVNGIGPKRMREFSDKFSYEVASQVRP